MAKKINLADLVFKISDDGTLKAFSGNAKKAGKSLGNVGKQTDKVTYATKKGVNMTANATKNFSNMSRGISGSLVPAYATLAANVFALTAVFGFLKGAADYRLLQEGQAAYAAVTGIAYKTLTNTIIEATDAQIKYSDAAQAAAIGTAAGLTPEQLGKLGAAAKTVSIALGRDVTDSFNRLIRGTTKAEPELLDELGIILRLDTATRNYAASLGVTKESLNSFQRTQAVTVDVLNQVETKFSAINAIMDPQTNQINKLAKSFDDLMNSLRMLLAGPAEGLASFFAGNIMAAVGALGLFTLPIVQSILPAFDEWEKKATTSLQGHDAAVEKSTNRLKAYARLQRMNAAKAQANPVNRLKTLSAGMDTKPNSALARMQSGSGLGSGPGQLTPRQLANMKAQATKGIGIFKNMDTTIKAHWIKTMNEMSRATKVPLTQSVSVASKNMELRLRMTGVKIKAAWSASMIGVQRISAVTARVVSKAFGFLSFLSIAVLAFEGLKAGAEKFGLLNKEAEGADTALGKLVKTQRELNKELENMLNADKNLAEADLKLTFNQLVKRQGNRLISANLEGTLKALKKNRALQKELAGGAAEGPMSAVPGKIQAMTPHFTRGTDKLTMQYPAGTNAAEQAEYQTQLTALKEAEKLMLNGEGEQGGLIKRIQILAETFSQLKGVVVDGKLAFDKLNKEQVSFIANTIESGNAVKYLEQSEKSYQQALQGRMGKASPQRSLMLLAQARTAAGESVLKTDQGTPEEQKAAQAEYDNAKAVSTAMELEAAAVRLLKTTQDLNKERAEGIKHRIFGSTKYAAKLQKELDIQTKQVQLAQLAAEIKELEAIFDKASDPVTARENIENKQASYALLLAQKTTMEDTINLTKQLGIQATAAFENGMIKGIQGMIQGTMTLKDAFKSMAQGILQSLAQVLAQMMAMKIMGGMFGITPMATGGIIPMAKGGITGYRNGGIATEPTYLVGEGKHNEAVVPLPDGRSIPVNMKGGSGGNNVVINVDASGGSSSTGNSEQGKALGMAIQAAVMETIQREKRPGGVLSRS